GKQRACIAFRCSAHYSAQRQRVGNGRSAAGECCLGREKQKGSHGEPFLVTAGVDGSGIRRGLDQFACCFQVLLQLGQGFPGEGGDLGVFGAGSPLEQFDGLLVGVDLIVGVGGVEGLAVTGLQDQGLGLVHQGGFVSHFQPLVRCQLGQLLVGGGVVLDHAFGEGTNLIILGLFQRLLG